MAARKSLQADVDDDFWDKSAFSKRKNPFDDKVDLDSAKIILSQQPTDDFDNDNDDDTINFDGSSVTSGKVEYNRTASARYRPAGDTVAFGANSTVPSRPAVSSSASGEFSSRHSTQNISIADAVSAGSVQRQPMLTDVSKLETEITFLRRLVETTKKENYNKIPVTDCIRRILLGEPYSLDKYKSKEDKLQLLDEAVKSHDGNAIVIAALFFRDMIKPQIFNLEMTLRPRACEHYINHLRQLYETDKLMDFLGMLGRSDEAAMLRYRQALANRSIDTKLKAIRTCHQSHFQSSSTLSLEASLINEHIALLERQMPIEASDSKDVERGVPIFRELPRTASLIDNSVITTLYYCCLYHYELPENNLASPQAIRKVHRLTEKQFVWIAISARARLRRWNEIDALFSAKGWFGGTKMRPVVGFDRVVALLHKMSAPREVLNKFCNLVDVPERRLEVGQKYNCHESVIETYMNLKDRLQLSAYQSRLKVNSPEWFHAENILRNSSIRWKN